ncbi:MAG: iron ABC transporter permease [Bradyrhizobiaceae bacterium]|nr:iron ABC transporter permease [Bradyrhizobiaceae bacterium]
MTARTAARAPAAIDSRGWTIAAFIIAAIVLSPVAALVAIAAQGSGDLWPHLLRYVLPNAIRDTGLLLLGVGVLVSIIGVGTAWLVATCRFPGRDLFDWALLLPLAVPTYIVAFAYLDVLHPLGPIQSGLRALFGIDDPRGLSLPDIRSIWGAAVLLGFVLYPYVYLAARALFLMQTASALEVARTLGATRTATFFRVALPLARPAIVVGTTLALLEALNDIGASEFLGVRTFTVSIYATWLNRSSLPGAAQIALVMLAAVIALVLAERWARRKQRFTGGGRRTHPPSPVELGGLAAAGAFLACLLPILIGFAVPALHLAVEAWSRVSAFGLSPQLLIEARNSIGFAAVATAIALLVGIVLAYAARLDRSGMATAATRVASLGYAIPGTVLAVGLLMPLATFDNALDAASRQLFGIGTGLLISGSGAALVLAYVIRFLAISAGGIEAGFAKIPTSLDAAARSLGESAIGTVRRVHLPLLSPALGAAAILVFVDCMKELPATLLLRPFGFETLATHIYAEASRGTYEDGAVAALLIVLVGLGPVVLLARMSRPLQVLTGRVNGSAQDLSAGKSR